MRGALADDSDANFIVVGVHEYKQLGRLDGVVQDVKAFCDLLTELGFRRSQGHLDTNCSAAEVRDAFDQWMKELARKSVIYWGGHGRRKGADGLFLPLRDADPYRLTSKNAIDATELADYVALSRVEEVLLILDTCHAGGAAPGFFGQLWKALDEQREPDRSVWLLAAVSAPDRAVDTDAGGRLVQDLVRLIRGGVPREIDPAIWTQNDEFIKVEDLYRALERLNPSVTGRPELSGRRPMSERFLRNLGFRRGVPEETIPAARGRRPSWLDRDEAESHFLPASRGVEVRETGWHFTGRERLLRQLVTWLQSGEQPQLQVITGLPGAGKSAVLGRLATLSDPAYRMQAEREGVLNDAPPRTVPEVGAIGMSILLRGRTLDDCIRRVAAGSGIDIPANKRPVVADVLEQLSERGSKSEVVLLDALDEATEPYQIADFIRQLAQERRVLLGSRRNLGRGSGQTPDDLGPLLKRLRVEPRDVVHLELDQEARADIERYVQRRLTDPASDCDYQWNRAVINEAASEIGEHANGVFRLAGDWCRLLCREPAALAPGTEQFRRLLHEGANGVFARELDRFESDKDKARELLSALAWSEGVGMPRQRIWSAVSSAIAGLPGCSGEQYMESDVIWALEHAGPLVVEAGEHGRTVYRLYHQEFADYLREEMTSGN